jgi:hypothetical protein
MDALLKINAADLAGKSVDELRKALQKLSELKVSVEQLLKTPKISNNSPAFKEAMKKLQLQTIPEKTSELRTETSTEIEYELDWSTFPSEKELSLVEYNALHRINAAFRGLCVDPVAKRELAAVKRIIVGCMATADKSSLSFVEGVLRVNICFTSAYSDSEISKFLIELLHIEEKKLLNELINENIPSRTKELNEIFGNKTKIAIEVDKDSLHMNKVALSFVDNTGLFRAVAGVRGASARSEVAKEAFQHNLRKIVIKGVDSFGEKQMLFENGVLTVKNCFSLMDVNTMERKYFENIEIEQFLMNNLKLEEAQMLKELKEKIVPEREKELREEFKLQAKYDVDWNSFTTKQELNFFDNMTGHRINMALRCNPTQNLKQIKIKNVKDPNQKQVSYKNGVLELHCNFESGLSGCFGDSEIGQALKSAKA